jgi:NAD(P)-dependent dehydrogenase (short-subunit alcohol dehydrogenase family)
MRALEGKVTVITGGSSGIGRAAALAFAREGAKVVLAARGAERGIQVAREIETAGGDAVFVTADVSRSDDVAALVKTTVETFGRLDCAFNNAGVVGNLALTADLTEDEFERIIGINLKGVWLCMKYEIEQMLRQDPPGGAIVNTSSVNGLGGCAQASPYSAAKAGVLGLTKSAALEYAPHDIRVNALAAGAFRTPLLEDAIEELSGGDPESREALEAQYDQEIALGRIGRPEEAAEAVVWLCSDPASYVTGHSMIVDGGMTATMR